MLRTKLRGLEWIPFIWLFLLTSISYTRIPIHERVELPESLIPADSRVEIDAKITAGGFPYALIFTAI